MSSFHVRYPMDMYNTLCEHAQRKGVSFTKLVKTIVTERFDDFAPHSTMVKSPKRTVKMNLGKEVNAKVEKFAWENNYALPHVVLGILERWIENEGRNET